MLATPPTGPVLGLEAVDNVTMVSVPDLMAAYEKGSMIDSEGLQAVLLGLIAHCELMGDRVAILERATAHECPAGSGVASRQGRL